jgi:hypothetical protein
MSSAGRPAGNVMWTPLAGRIDRGFAPSSRALGGTDRPGVRPLVEGPELVGPHPGGVDHHGRPGFDFPAADPVGQSGARDLATLPEQAGGLHPVHRHGPQGGGGLGHGEGEAGVVDPGVVVQEAGGQAPAVEIGHELEGLPLRQPLVQLPDAGAAGGVVHPQGGADSPGVGPGPGPTCRPASEYRDEEGEGLDQVGGEAEQSLSLGQRLVDQPELLLLEVPQPAVDQLRGSGRRAGGEVAPLDEGRPQAPAGGVEGDTGTGDPAADHEHVEGLRGQSLEVPLPLAGVEVHCLRMLVTGG